MFGLLPTLTASSLQRPRPTVSGVRAFNLCEGSTCSGGKRCKHGLLGEVLRVCQELFGVHQVKKTVPVMANQ